MLSNLKKHIIGKAEDAHKKRIANEAVSGIVDYVRPLMIEVYKRNEVVRKLGFVFDDEGNLSNSNDEEIKRLTRGLGRHDNLLLRPLPERFSEVVINPFKEVKKLIACEDMAYEYCLEFLNTRTKNKELTKNAMFLHSKDENLLKLAAVPWRHALTNLYPVFCERKYAIQKLLEAEPIQVLGLVAMIGLFAKELNIKVDADQWDNWTGIALRYALISYAE